MGASSSVLLQLLPLRRRRVGKDRHDITTGSTPDVIEAHERYDTTGLRYRRSCLSISALEPLQQLPSHPHPSPPCSAVNLDRKLPTQHQHPGCSTTIPFAPYRVESSEPVVSLSLPSQSSCATRRHSHHHHYRSCSTCPSCPGSGPRRRSSRSHSKSKSRSNRHRSSNRSGFGYEIQDVDEFLEKASLESPANIPMVLSCASVLYRTREGGWQEEVPLPLGMVVNGVFLVASWLYAQTPHGHEGYVSYSACIPLGILPSSRPERQPCWDTASDVFPVPSGNRTDPCNGSEKSFEVVSVTYEELQEAEKHLDALFLSATRQHGSHQLGTTRSCDQHEPKQERALQNLQITLKSRSLILR